MDRLMEAQFVTRSTDSGLYISGSNSSARYSRMPASFVYPDGRLLRLDRHKPGLLYADFPGEPLGWTLQTYLARPI